MGPAMTRTGLGHGGTSAGLVLLAIDCQNISSASATGAALGGWTVTVEPGGTAMK